jgi:hypothetical protein
MPHNRAIRQRQLFEEEPPAAPAVRLPPDVQQRLREALAQCLRELAKRLREERGTSDE